MQTLIRMDMIVIEDNYHMTRMNENMNWMKLKHLVKFIMRSCKPQGALLYIYLYCRFLNSLPSCTHYRKVIPLPYNQILIPLLTLTLVHTWYESLPLGCPSNMKIGLCWFQKKPPTSGHSILLIILWQTYKEKLHQRL